jgi:hypothetical protein
MFNRDVLTVDNVCFGRALRPLDVRFWSQTDMTRSNHDVRYSPKSGQRSHGIYEYTA